MNILIKPIYIIIGVMLMLTACSQGDEPYRIDSDSKQILFRTSLPEITTRAKVITDANLPYFYVTAFDIDDQSKILPNALLDTLFANQKIEIVRDKETFTSPYCCWPDPTKETDRVSFFGFYPGLPEVDGAQLVNASTARTVDYKLTGFRVAKEIADQLDFVTAYTSGTMADNLFSGITLPFAHQLSRIEIKAYGAHKSCNIEIAGVRIGGTGVESTFNFKPIDGTGEWSTPTRGIVEYIYREGDMIVNCGKKHPVSYDDAVSIMGKKRADGNNNCAMLIPSTYAAWDHANDHSNNHNQMYISVLLRVTDATDATPTAGVKPVDKQRYPYKDLSQGVDALKIAPAVYLAVNKESGVVSTRLYKNDSGYFTDAAFKSPYTLAGTDEIREFGWAALPVDGTWEPGYIYTYTLDYTGGVGLHDPEVTTKYPGAGDPVISDRVGLTYTLKEWNVGGDDEFPVPGS